MKPVTEIKKKLDILTASLTHSVIDRQSNTRNQLNVEYGNKIVGEVGSLLELYVDNEAEQAARFFDCLKKNEQLVHGNLLYYTCIPEAPVTKLLCEVAIWVSEVFSERTPVTPMSILMPSLNLVSLYPEKFPDLCANEVYEGDKLTDGERKTLENLQEIAPLEAQQITTLSEELNVLLEEKNKQHNKNAAVPPNSLNNHNDVDDLGRNINKLEKRLEHLQKNREKQQQLEDALRQEIFNNAHYYSQKEYNVPKISLEDVLKTHILSEDGACLIPGAVLLDDDPINPYHPNYGPLTAHEIKRLENHNDEAKNYHFAKKNMKIFGVIKVIFWDGFVSFVKN